MLETGFKQIIINDADDIKYNADANELQLFGSAALTGATQHGHINIPMASIDTMSMYESLDAIPGVFTYTLSTGSSSLAVGDVITVSFDFSTMKDQGEFNNLRIEGSDILTFQVVLAAATTDGIAAKIAAWFIAGENAETIARYHVASCTASSSVLTMTMTEWSVYPTSLVLDDDAGSATGVTYVLANTVVADQGVGLPILMEQKVQKDTFRNKSAYALGKNAKINVNTKYNVLSIRTSFTSTTSSVGSVISGGAAQKQTHYIIYVDEDINLAASAKVISADPTAPTTAYLDKEWTTLYTITGVEKWYASTAASAGVAVTPAQEAVLMDSNEYLVVRG